VQFNQLSTYGGHPVACAVGLENLAIIAEQGLVENSARMGAALLDGLRELAADHPIVGQVRGKGLLCGVELAVPGTTEPLAVEHVNQVMREAQARGVLVGKNVSTVRGLECVITLSPPLVISQPEIERIVAVLDEALGTVKI
jgi:taurine-pyruvate aminotransferase